MQLNYRTMQNFERRKFWRNSSHQKLVDSILAHAQNFQSAKSNNYALTFIGKMESQNTPWHVVKMKHFTIHK